MSMSETIRFYRTLNGLSQEDLAKKICCDRSYITKIETGVKIPSVLMVKALATALNITPNEILSFESRKECEESE